MGSNTTSGMFGIKAFMPPAARALGAFVGAHPQLALSATDISPASLARRPAKIVQTPGPFRACPEVRRRGHVKTQEVMGFSPGGPIVWLRRTQNIQHPSRFGGNLFSKAAS